MIAILLFIVASAPENWRVLLPTPHKFTFHSVVVNADGIVFLADFWGNKVFVLNSDGTLRYILGKENYTEGVGEFKKPRDLFLCENTLYITDAKSITAVNAISGNVFFRHKAAAHAVFFPSEKGLLYYPSISDINEKTMLFECDLEARNCRELWELPLSSPITQDFYRKEFNPAKARDFRFLHPLTNTLFHFQKESDTLIVVDSTGKAQTFRFGLEPISFNQAWAEREYEQYLKKNQNLGIPTKELGIPQFFPFFRNVFVAPTGNPIVELWSANPDGKRPLFEVLPNGELREEKNLTHSILERVVGWHNEYAFIWVYNAEEDQSGLAKVHQDQLELFIQENPIVDWEFWAARKLKTMNR